MTGRKFARAIALLALLFPFAAPAEVVRIQSADGRFGQGWMHVAADGRCLVALPAHVVPAGGRGLATSATGRQYEVQHPHQPDAAIDLALMSVPVPAGTFCTPSRLGPSDLQSRIASLGAATMVTMDEGERRTMAVHLVAAAIDDGAGRVLAFRPANVSEHFRQGMSGSTILTEDGTMIAMLTDVDAETGIGIGLRFDVIRRLSERAPRPAPTGGPVFLVVVEQGQSTDPAQPPSNLAGGGVWRARAVAGRLGFVASLPAIATVSALRIDLACGADQIARAALTLRADPGNPYSAEVPCRIERREDTAAISCPTPPRKARDLRLNLAGKGSDEICLGNLAIAAQ